MNNDLKLLFLGIFSFISINCFEKVDKEVLIDLLPYYENLVNEAIIYHQQENINKQANGFKPCQCHLVAIIEYYLNLSEINYELCKREDYNSARYDAGAIKYKLALRYSQDLGKTLMKCHKDRLNDLSKVY